MGVSVSRGLFRSVSRFGQDRRGGVAVVFAAAGITLCLMVAGGIELHRRSLAVAVMQKATDAAALAAKRIESDLRESLGAGAAKTRGEAEGAALFSTTLSQDGHVFGATLPTPAFSWLQDGSVKVDASGVFEMAFAALMPGNFGLVATTATVGYGVPTPTEVALVLDNTASMFQKDGRPATRFTQLRDAAKSFTHTLFDAAQQAGDNSFLRMSVVPWTTTVNVKGEAPAAPDFSGSATIIPLPDKGSQTLPATPMLHAGRVTVPVAAFGAVGWRGCVSGSSETQTTSDAGGMTFDALVVPSPVLGQAHVGFGDDKDVVENHCQWNCQDDGRTNCGGGGGGGGGTQGFNDLLRRVLPEVAPAALLGDRLKSGEGQATDACMVCTPYNCQPRTVRKLVCDTWQAYTSCWQDISAGRRNPYMANAGVCASSSCNQRNTPVATTPVGPCVGDPNEPGLRNGTVKWCPWVPATGWTKHDPITGPNLNCPTPMLGLSGNRRQVLQTLDRMTPVPGGTHADVGLRWGLRTLSANGNWPQFFGLTKMPATFKGQDRKVMVLITDGENSQAVDYPGYWGCSSASNPGCAGSPDKARLDQMMLSWCSAMKVDYGVELYTIAVNFSNPGAVALLRQCAPDASHFYNIDAADLKKVLNVIAGSIIRLRITS